MEILKQEMLNYVNVSRVFITELNNWYVLIKEKDITSETLNNETAIVTKRGIWICEDKKKKETIDIILFKKSEDMDITLRDDINIMVSNNETIIDINNKSLTFKHGDMLYLDTIKDDIIYIKIALMLDLAVVESIDAELFKINNEDVDKETVVNESVDKVVMPANENIKVNDDSEGVVKPTFNVTTVKEEHKLPEAEVITVKEEHKLPEAEDIGNEDYIMGEDFIDDIGVDDSDMFGSNIHGDMFEDDIPK